MKLLALTIGGQAGSPSFDIKTPFDVTAISNLTLNQIVHNGITLLLYVIILLSFIFVVIAGLKWMISQGDKKAVDEARKTLTFAIGGLVLAFLSFFIVNLIGYAFGIPLLGR